MIKALWFLGIYPGGPHNIEAILIYGSILLVGVVLLTLFGFLGTKKFRHKMKAINRWLTCHTDPSNLVVDPHKPLVEVTKQQKDLSPANGRSIQPSLSTPLTLWQRASLTISHYFPDEAI